MSDVRKRKSKNEGSGEAPEAMNKRSRRAPNEQSAKGSSHTQGPVDPVFGQRSALPGLDELGSDSEASADDGGIGLQALRYLQAVRKEASLIPPYIVAESKSKLDEPDRSIYENGVGDSRGYYNDGAYTAAADLDDDYDENEEEWDEEYTAQDGLRETILAQFNALRKNLSSDVPLEIAQRLGDNHGYVAEPTHNSSRQWLWRFKNTDPQPAQLALMTKGTVLRLLKLLNAGKGGLIGPQREIAPRTSQWLWSLLARMPDRGELLSEEIGVIRELGKMAVRISVAWRDVGNWGEQIDDLLPENDDDEEDDTGNAGDSMEVEMTESDGARIEATEATTANDAASSNEQVTEADLAAAKARLLSSLIRLESTEKAGEADSAEAVATAREPPLVSESTSMLEVERPTSNTRLTVEMILTIAGEIYGQRDLLEFRELWD